MGTSIVQSVTGPSYSVLNVGIFGLQVADSPALSPPDAHDGDYHHQPQYVADRETEHGANGANIHKGDDVQT
jgi:hypothetical protein